MATLDAKYLNLSKNENAVFQLVDEPEISYNLSSFEIPGMNTGTIPIANPFLEVQAPGTKLIYDELTVESMVDEEFTNWRNAVEWIREGNNGMTFSTKNITRKNATIILLTNNMNPFAYIKFKNVFPTAVGTIQVDMQQAEAVPMTFSLTLQYESYSLDFPE